MERKSVGKKNKNKKIRLHSTMQIYFLQKWPPVWHFILIRIRISRTSIFINRIKAELHGMYLGGRSSSKSVHHYSMSPNSTFVHAILITTDWIICWNFSNHIQNVHIKYNYRIMFAHTIYSHYRLITIVWHQCQNNGLNLCDLWII